MILDPKRDPWPELHLVDWVETKETLHRFTQVVGKVRLALAPRQNHWWQVPLYLSARGLTTSPIPDGGRVFEIAFDFLDHQLRIDSSDGARSAIVLRPMAVADFHHELMALLRGMGVDVSIRTATCEIPGETLTLDVDRVHASYDPEYAQRFFQALVSTSEVMARLRRGFLGKESPIHFFWGSFDLALTFFSGRAAPARPGADGVTREAYSHEVMSVGFWPGGGAQDASFYAYASPEPPGFAEEEVQGGGHYDPSLKEFLLPYEAVRRSEAPAETLLSFFSSAYDLCADLGGWDRASLERRPPEERGGGLLWSDAEDANAGLS
ncbi:MAG TPA: DUF5996 family protein [Anaeromyxobacteraceae bacterium]|jgi:hypothetical protein|nr:DUF5996 family protein [Anaeromyxobacteraceae bacterium]